MTYHEMANLSIGAQVEIRVEISKSGLPCLWECGGGYTNTGGAQIICDHFGNAKKAIFVPRKGVDIGGAVIPVVAGDIIINNERWHEKNLISVIKIQSINNSIATLKVIYRFSHNGNSDYKGKYDNAINAAIDKSNDYHCRSVYYARY